MARIVAIQKGAPGTVKAVAEDGSLFLFRPEYLSHAYRVLDPDALPPGLPYDVPLEIPGAVLELASEALLAETRALALLARAEQFRLGLERKLMAREKPAQAVKAALDRLEAEGLLSDERYAAAWIRQRLRTKAEGPRSLESLLASKGIERHALRRALASALDGDDKEAERRSALAGAARKLAGKGLGPAASRRSLVKLGWRGPEVDDALDSLDVQIP